MLSLARGAFCIAALFCLMVEPRANASQDAAPAGAVSGRVTINGKPAPRVYVVMSRFGNSPPAGRPLRAITDQEGNYRLTGVPEGRYQINPVATSMILARFPEFVRGGIIVSGGPAPSGIIVTVSRDEELTGIDFALAPGGVITGRVTDAGGRPLIEASVSCNRINERGHYKGASAGRIRGRGEGRLC